MSTQNKKPTLLKHVQGNVLRVALPLTQIVKQMTEGVVTETEQDFYPNPNFPTVITLKGHGSIKYTFNAVVEGNVAHFGDNADMQVGIYQVEVKCRDAQENPMRYMVRSIIEVVDATIDAGIEAGIEFDSEEQILDGTVFFYAKGDKGDPFTYDDFTPEQILDLKRPALEAAAVADNAARLANEKAQLAAEKAEEARLAAINARADYVGQDNYVYHWNTATQQYEKTELYVKGDQGVSIESVEQIVTSTESGGINVVRVTLSNGVTSDFDVKNGVNVTPTYDSEHKNLIIT